MRRYPAQHLMRVVKEAGWTIVLSVLLAEYKRGGTSSDHPKMLLKVKVYAWDEKI
jgi:hypothetical protein